MDRVRVRFRVRVRANPNPNPNPNPNQVWTLTKRDIEATVRAAVLTRTLTLTVTLTLTLTPTLTRSPTLAPSLTLTNFPLKPNTCSRSSSIDLYPDGPEMPGRGLRRRASTPRNKESESLYATASDDVNVVWPDTKVYTYTYTS